MTDRLQEAIVRWFEALKVYEKAFDNYDGYSWDYDGGYLIERLNKTKIEFNNAMDEYIDIKISERRKSGMDK